MVRIDIVSSPSAALAQLVEHLIRNERVAGSNPASGSINSVRVRWSAGVEPRFDHHAALSGKVFKAKAKR